MVQSAPLCEALRVLAPKIQTFCRSVLRTPQYGAERGGHAGGEEGTVLERCRPCARTRLASHRFFVRARGGRGAIINGQQRDATGGGGEPQLEGLIDVSSVVISEKEDL